MDKPVTQEEIVEALNALACLGNGNTRGNSIGNDIAGDLLDKIQANGIAPPDGSALVPIEPTAGMVEAYSRASEQLTKNHLLSGSYPAIWQPIEAGYKAMLAAAPKQENSNE